MPCKLYNEVIETPTHYVGCTGNEYPKNEYTNHGYGGEKYGFKDLPIDEYPYTIKYHVERKYNWCNHCNCEGK